MHNEAAAALQELAKAGATKQAPRRTLVPLVLLAAPVFFRLGNETRFLARALKSRSDSRPEVIEHRVLREFPVARPVDFSASSTVAAGVILPVCLGLA